MDIKNDGRILLEMGLRSTTIILKNSKAKIHALGDLCSGRAR
jgi:hypothetical protein